MSDLFTNKEMQVEISLGRILILFQLLCTAWTLSSAAELIALTTCRRGYPTVLDGVRYICSSDLFTLEYILTHVSDDAPVVSLPSGVNEFKIWKEFEREHLQPVMIPSKHAIDITERNKTAFIEYLTSIGYSDYMPKLYNSQNMKFPLVVKLRPLGGSDSKGVLMIKSRNQWDENADIAQVIARNDSLLIQEAILSHTEVIYHYGTFQGEALRASLPALCINYTHHVPDMIHRVSFKTDQ